MTAKQIAFAEAWMETLNKSEAARRAGYSERSAASIGYENLRKPEIREYIHARLRTLAHTADMEEAMAFLTKVMRGEVKDQFGLDVSVADRLKAAEQLMKRYATVEYQQAESGTREIKILSQPWEDSEE